MIFKLSLFYPHKKTSMENFHLPPLMVDSKYRIWRHVIFIAILAINTFDMVLLAYKDCIGMMGNYIHLVCFFTLAMYAATLYFNYYCLIPKLLLKNKYVIYMMVLAVIVFFLTIFVIAQEYWVRNALALPHRITSYTNPLILVDNLASSVLITICFLGMSAIVLLRHWMSREERVSQMEYEHLKSEINKLKGQVAPEFLSRTLNHASTLVKTNPEMATNLLMRLGQLLRYQLYDCNRDKVLLKSEINFLTNFLDLEQLNNSRFEYQIQTEGALNNVFAVPLLFISFIQEMIENNASYINVAFFMKDRTLVFRCASDRKNKQNDHLFLLVRKRLELAYPHQHVLSIDSETVELQIEITE